MNNKALIYRLTSIRNLMEASCTGMALDLVNQLLADAIAEEQAAMAGLPSPSIERGKRALEDFQQLLKDFPPS